jgi:anti-sigma factor RsiW
MDERLERLINRQIDDELSDAERAELDRELLKDPSARQMLMDYRRLDEMSQDALRAELRLAAIGQRPTGSVARRPRWERLWPRMAMVAAAAVLIFALLPPRTLDEPARPVRHARPTTGRLMPTGASAAPMDVMLRPQQVAFPERPMTEGWPTQRARQRTVTVFGIYDAQSGEVLLLQLDHQQDAAKMISREY